MSDISLIQHPFKEGVARILIEELGERIGKRFTLLFEAQMFRRDLKNIWAQNRDKNYILEVHYRQKDDTFTYVCDVHSWWTRKYTTWFLLDRIAKKVREGKLGQDWTDLLK